MTNAITKKYKLEAKTFSKKCIDEIKGYTQDVVVWKKLYVAEVGYVFYLKNANDKTIAHVFREKDSMVLSVKL